MNFKINCRLATILLTVFFSLILLTTGLEAQYFGRNKVQYEHFDFKVLKTKHFDVYYYPEFRDIANDAARMAERWYARLSRILNHELKGRQPLILYSSSPHFQQTTAIPGVIGEGTGGVTEAFKRRIILPLGSSLAETDHVIGHELVHAFQYDITSQGYGGGMSNPGALRLPLWFIEGMAEYLSIGSVDANTSMWMRDATMRKEIPPLKKLDNPYKYFPYRYGQALWAYITGRWGDETVARLMKGVGRVGDLESTMTRVLGVSYEALSKEWLEAYKKAYDPLVAQTKLPEATSKIIFQGTEMNPYNVSPTLSPDGKNIIFLSTRDLFSIDLYLADARMGKIKKKITETAVNPEFESLQFIHSSGAWDARGKKFVFGAITKGKPILTFFDVDREKIVDEIEFPRLDEIFNPTWSPDERSIVFSALAGGKTDLYLYDLRSKSLKQLTDDPFGDLQPAWSPDGKSIAFVTDRFGTDLSLLKYGDYELALIDPASGKIERVHGFAGAKSINPQWSADSRSLYFVSDVSGKPDIYRIELDTKKVFQVTNLYTGVSGISELSPALSVAQETGRLIYCAYEKGEYSIFSLDDAETLRGNPDLARFDGRLLSVLPPREQPEGALLGLLRNPLFGLPEQAEFPASEYKPKLSLDYISPPQVGIGVDRFGTYTGGGVALFWTDMLGYHSLGTLVQTSSRLKDLTGILSYQNSQRRLNWGGAVGRIPYVTGYSTLEPDPVYGGWQEKDYLYWQINYELQGSLFYPFNQVRRLEVRSGFEYIDFSQEIVTYYLTYDGQQIGRDIQSLPAPKSLKFFYTSLALVYDSALWGATGPILGQSYLFEFTPGIGSIQYNTMMADYRRYFIPAKPFTLAFRVLHYGRYGRDADDSRLWPLYIGYDSLVRGYDYYSFSNDELTGADSFDFNRIFGSKILVANAELRFPLFRVLGIGKGYYGILPIDMVLFYDWGVTWSGDTKPTFFNGTQKPVSSAGVGLRFNVFGYLILGVNAVKPFDRPHKNWVFQFSFFPGF
jgi:Tol biopolymer transport system component